MVVGFKHFKKISLIAGLFACLAALPLFSDQWQSPPQPLNSPFAGALASASSANGTAMMIVVDETGSVFAYHLSGAAWSTPALIASTSAKNPVVSMDDAGRALVIYADKVNGDIFAVFFNGTTWAAPALLGTVTYPGIDFSIVSVAMKKNGTGQGVAVWTNQSGFQAFYSLFSGGVWTAAAPIPGSLGNADFSPIVQYSDNGNIAAIWGRGLIGGLFADNFIAGAWSASPTLLDAHPNDHGAMGMDANGRAIAVWINTPGQPVYSTSTGSGWSAALPITSSLSNSPPPTLLVNQDGTAIAAWTDSSLNGISSTFNGSAWGAPIQFGSNLTMGGTSIVDPSNIALVVDKSGNTFVTFSAIPGGILQVRSAELPAGAAAWTDMLEVDPDSSPGALDQVVAAIVGDPVVFTAWLSVVGDGSSSSFGSFLIITNAPPTPGITGTVCRNRFATGSERVKIVSWQPFTDAGIASYQVRRNGKLIATVPATGPLVHKDRGRCKKTDVYTVSAVDASGNVLSTKTVSIK